MGFHFGWCGYDVDKVIWLGPIRICDFDTLSYPYPLSYLFLSVLHICFMVNV